MTIEVCIETVAVLAEAVTTGVQQALVTKARSRFSRVSCEELPPAEVTRTRVREAAELLPFDEARAVWLVDMCGYTYSEGADATRLTPAEFGDLVASARRQIRRLSHL